MAFVNNIKNIAPNLSDIKTGTPLIKIGSNYVVGGIGGNSIPCRQCGSSTNMNFYKCASVDTINHKWTGYKAIFNNLKGYYEFEETITNNLTYDPLMIIPVINECYTNGALLHIEPYSPGIIQVDVNTMFLLQGSLHDKSGHVADANIVNNGVVIDAGKLTFPNNGYATIVANSLPDTVLCDNHDWTIEAKVNITSTSNYSTIFGKERDPRGDLTVGDGRVFFNMGEGNNVQKDATVIGEHLIKLTHTAANAFMVYVDGVAGHVTQGSSTVSGRNYRSYDMGIGKDAGSYGSYYFSPNTIDWLRISDCIR